MEKFTLADKFENEINLKNQCGWSLIKDGAAGRLDLGKNLKDFGGCHENYIIESFEIGSPLHSFIS